MHTLSPIDIIRPALQELLLFPVLRHYAGRIEICGLENLAGLKGSAVFVANHSSHADTAIILRALPLRFKQNLAIAAAADYFYKNKAVGAVVTAVLNTFPFERNHPRQAIKTARECLKHGDSLLIYPEGHRAQPDEEVCFKNGFASLACQFGLPVVPISIEGSYELLPKGAKWPQRSKIRICFGQPIYPAGKNKNEIAVLAQNKVIQQLKHAA